MSAIDRAWQNHGDGDLRKLAHIHATAFHETGREHGPKDENLNYTSASRTRGVWPSRFTLATTIDYVRQLQNWPIRSTESVAKGLVLLAMCPSPGPRRSEAPLFPHGCHISWSGTRPTPDDDVFCCEIAVDKEPGSAEEHSIFRDRRVDLDVAARGTGIYDFPPAH